jgi:hypothetical protein
MLVMKRLTYREYRQEEARAAIVSGSVVNIVVAIGHGAAWLRIDGLATADQPGWRYRTAEWPHVATPDQHELIANVIVELGRLGLTGIQEVTVVDGDDLAPWGTFICQPNGGSYPHLAAA